MRTLAPCSGSLSLRFRIFSLTSHAYTDSQAHSSIGTASGINALRLFVGMQFQDLFTPLPGFFSPFPHGTGSLSVAGSYLALRGGPRVFGQDYSCPDLLWIQLDGLGFGYGAFTLSGMTFKSFPLTLAHVKYCCPKPQIALVWASPRSLAATDGIDLSFFSSRYFDVSVPWVASTWLCVPMQ